MVVDDGSRVVAGRYRLHEKLGSGGMGTVWRAEDFLLGRDVAVKEVIFPPGVSAEEHEVLRERTRREARAAAQLDHPGAVTVHDVVEEGGATYLVMQYVPARTLSEVLREDGPLSPQRTAQVGIALLNALRAAHACDIVHRDVKPSNVLMCESGDGSLGRVVLTDFGIASSPGDSRLTSTGLLVGSPGYISPERARGDVPGPGSDLWSLGATLFTAVEGRPPYEAEDAMATLTAVMVGQHAPYLRAGPLQEVLAGLLDRDPDRRMSADQAAHALDGVASAPDREPVTAPLPPVPGSVDEGASARTAVLHLERPRRVAEPAEPVAPAQGADSPHLAGTAAAPVADPSPRSRRWRPGRLAWTALALLVALGALAAFANAVGLLPPTGRSPAGGSQLPAAPPLLPSLPVTTTPPAPTTTSALPTRSLTPTFPKDVTSPTQGGVYFAVYLAVVKEGQSDNAAKAAESSARAVGYETGTSEIDCEQGARGALKLDNTAGYQGTSIFFATAAQAKQFVDAYEPGVVGTAKITAYCLD